jgi:hypothetical protein
VVVLGDYLTICIKKEGFSAVKQEKKAFFFAMKWPLTKVIIITDSLT